MDPWFWVEAGRRLVDFIVQRGAPFHSDVFVKAYTDALGQSQSVIRFIDQNDDERELREGARALLRLLTQVITAYHRKDVGINANYMMPVAATAQNQADARFCRKGRSCDSFRCFLKLEDWAYPDPGVPGGLLLPVELPDERLATDTMLFGAPRAFIDLKSYLVNDTDDGELWRHLRDHENENVRKEVADYFKAQRARLRSFISIPVQRPADVEGQGGEAIAVINVQSSRTHIMGLFEGNQKKLELTMAPLIKDFAYFVSKLQDAPGNQMQGPSV